MQPHTTPAPAGQARARAQLTAPPARPRHLPPPPSTTARRTAQALTVLLSLIGSAYLVKADLAAPAPDWIAIATTPAIWAAVISLPVLAGQALSERRHAAALLLYLAALVGGTYTLTGTLERRAEKRDAGAAQAADTAGQRTRLQFDLAAARARHARAHDRCESGRACTADTRALIVEREMDVSVIEASLRNLDRADPLAGERRIATALALMLGGKPDDHLPAVGLFLPAHLGLLLELAAFATAIFGFHSHPSSPDTLPDCSANRPESSAAAGQPSGVPSDTIRNRVLAGLLTDMAMQRPAASQRALCDRYGVPRSTMSDWLSDWERSGVIVRRTVGRRKAVAIA